jgi:hypothetical protein
MDFGLFIEFPWLTDSNSLRDKLGLTQILYEVNHGRQIPYALQLENLRLINERVIPQIK